LSPTAAGSYGYMESYTPRPVDNLLYPEGSVRLPVFPHGSLSMTYGSVLVAMSAIGSIAKTLVRNTLFYQTGSIIVKHQIVMMIAMAPTLTAVTVSITHMRILLSRHPTM
jgi:alpha-D-ribose 1-methylphosphonate 5-triphosphate synthase subunit PhnL